MAETKDENDVLVELDVGNLCVTNISLLKSSISKDINESKIKRVASVGVQKLLAEIFKLPSEYHEHVPVAKLPEPVTIIPREKHVPKPKPPTKWETFAKAKGIQKRKKDKLLWDDKAKDWKPRFGFRSAKNEKEWLMEIPDNADPNMDYFGKAQEEKKERVSKNEYQRLRNIATAQNVKVNNIESVDRADKHQLSRSIAAAKSATASVGYFQEALPKEKRPKNRMKKSKFKPNISDMKIEKENSLKLLERMGRKKPKLDVEEAVQKYIAKPMKEPVSEGRKNASAKKKNSKKNQFKKNAYRSSHKKGFKRPVK